MAHIATNVSNKRLLKAAIVSITATAKLPDGSPIAVLMACNFLWSKFAADA